jgi:purine catabolism regulator
MNDLLHAAATAIHKRASQLVPKGSVVIGVGSVVHTIDELRRSFMDASEAADAAIDLPAQYLFVTTADIRLRGLIHLLRDDPRVQKYMERELGLLIAYDRSHHTNLMATLSAYLDASGNKSAAAASLFMNRATFYHRLNQIERIISCDLDTVESRNSLYVALTVYRSFNS